jgi:tetratricopeptide (TPR) repeat protein
MDTPEASMTPNSHRTTPLARPEELVTTRSPGPPGTGAGGADRPTNLVVGEAVTRRSRLDAAVAARSRRGAEPIHLSPGTVIPGTRYRLLRWLGDGGMGVVYEAEHVDIERRVAVKILRPEVCDHPHAVQLFRDEARAAGRIGSAHIVEVVDFAELPDGRLLYAMELLSGQPLSRALGGRPMQPARVIAILRQVCKGLASAHVAHIVHRDIKPDNIFLLDRRRNAVKILDFGISIFLAEATATDASVVGTPHYLAPEIIAGMPFDARVDMYAVGCTGFEMLTGRPPFEGTILELFDAHLSAPPPSIAARRGDTEVPPELEAVITRCLAKLPADRYADMDDLEAALCEAQIAARLETAWDDLPLPNVEGERRDLLLRKMPDPTAPSIIVQRPRLRVVVTGALVGALVAGSVFLGRTLTATTEVPADPEIARLEAEARGAAARIAFVYPPEDDPGARTAYQVVLEIEALSEQGGRDVGRTLRHEFARTLGAYGDRLWERPGGLEFAVDAYAQALLFDPDLEPAASRANLTPGQLARLARKAALREFSETELVASEPLVILAESDKVEGSPALRRVRERIVKRTRDRDASLAQLAGAPEPTATSSSQPTAGDPKPRPDEMRRDPPGGDPEPRLDETRRDPSAAARLVQQAHTASREGKLVEAERLFERALAHDSRNAAALAGLTDIHFNRGAYSRALSFGKQALKLAPKDKNLHLLVGDAAFKAFQYDDARRTYERAKELGHPEAAGRLAKLAAKLAE